MRWSADFDHASYSAARCIIQAQVRLAAHAQGPRPNSSSSSTQLTFVLVHMQIMCTFSCRTHSSSSCLSTSNMYLSSRSAATCCGAASALAAWRDRSSSNHLWHAASAFAALAAACRTVTAAAAEQQVSSSSSGSVCQHINGRASRLLHLFPYFTLVRHVRLSQASKCESQLCRVQG